MGPQANNFLLFVEHRDDEAKRLLELADSVGLAGGLVRVPGVSDAVDFVARRGSCADRGPGRPRAVLIDPPDDSSVGAAEVEALRAERAMVQLPLIVFLDSQNRKRPQDSSRRADGYLLKPLRGGSLLSCFMYWTGADDVHLLRRPR